MKLYNKANSGNIWFRTEDGRKSSKTLLGEALRWDTPEHVRVAKKLCEKSSLNEVLAQVGEIVGEDPDVSLQRAVSVYLQSRAKKKNTKQNDQSALGHLVEQYTGTVAGIGFEELSSLGLNLLKGLAPSTVNLYFSIIKTFLRFCKKRGWVGSLPEFPEVRSPNSDPEIMSKKQYRTYLAVAKDCAAVYRYLRLGIYVIARARELLGIRSGDVNLEEGYIRLHRQKTETVQRYPISRELREVLTELDYKNRNYLIGPEYQEFYRRWCSLYRESSVSYFPPKTIRATAECWLLYECENTKLVASLAGHTLQTAEKHYLKYGIEELKSSVSEHQDYGIGEESRSKENDYPA